MRGVCLPDDFEVSESPQAGARKNCFICIATGRVTQMCWGYHCRCSGVSVSRKEAAPGPRKVKVSQSSLWIWIP